MLLLEYQAKELLAKHDVPIPPSVVVRDDSPITMEYPLIVKSQVPIGGRGKLGGIVKVNSDAEFQETVHRLLKLEIKSFTPTELLVEPALSIESERYLSLTIDRDESRIILLAHPDGGVEVETADPDKLLRVPIDDSITPDIIERITTHLQLNDRNFVGNLLLNLLACMREQDATLIEINPLIVTTGGTITCADCKMELDDNAAFRHEMAAETVDHNFVTIDEQGTVATLANGAGLAMATVDSVADSGLSVANFLDIGGGTNEATARAALEKLASFPSVRAIIINIFGGITKSDEVARAIVSARESIPNLPPIFARVNGNRQEEARSILEDAGMTLYPDVQSAIRAAKEELS